MFLSQGQGYGNKMIIATWYT